MVFLGGPRQVGKTTLAQTLIKNYRDGHPAYLNWDSAPDRKRIRERDWPGREKLIVLDEIHKARDWRTMVKGLYDTLKNSHRFLVTGSARLDYYRRGGDSLLGRYHYYRLHPFSLGELGASANNVQRLFTFGGFPEPLANGRARDLRRWHNERLYRLIYSDVRDLEHVTDMEKIALLAEELPNRVGSPLSTKSIAEDLLVDFKTAKRWIAILDSIYYCYQIAPFGPPRIRAVKKENKLYLWDWSQIDDEGIRFENMVGSHLLKYCHFVQDTQGYAMELRFLRDTDKREIDFVVLKNKKPQFAVECKLQARELSPHIPYFAERTAIPSFYQVHLRGENRRQVSDRIRMLPFAEFCEDRQLV